MLNTPQRVVMYADKEGKQPIPQSYIDATKVPDSTGDLISDTAMQFSYAMISGLPSIYLASMVIAVTLSRQTSVLEARRTEFVAEVSSKFFSNFAGCFIVEILTRQVSRQLTWFKNSDGGYGFWWVLTVLEYLAYFLYRVLVLARFNLYLTAFSYIVTSFYASDPRNFPDVNNALFSMLDMRTYRQNLTQTAPKHWYDYTWSNSPDYLPSLLETYGGSYAYRENFMGKVDWGVQYVVALLNLDSREKNGVGAGQSTVSSNLVMAAKLFNIFTGVSYADEVYVQIAQGVVPPPNDPYYYYGGGGMGIGGDGDPSGGEGGAVGGGLNPITARLNEFLFGSSFLCDQKSFLALIDFMGAIDVGNGRGGFTSLITVSAIKHTWINSGNLYYQAWSAMPATMDRLERGRLLISLGYLEANPPSPDFVERVRAKADAIMAALTANFFTYEYFNTHREALELIGFDLTYFDMDVQKGATGFIDAQVTATMVGVEAPELVLVDDTVVGAVAANRNVNRKVISMTGYVRPVNCGSASSQGTACCNPDVCNLAFKRFRCNPNGCTVSMTGSSPA